MNKYILDFLQTLSPSKILDIGCGAYKFKCSVGIDMLQLKGVDVVWNLNKFLWPFENNTFSRLIFKHSISHFDDLLKTYHQL